MSFWYMFSYALKDAISCICIDRKNNNAYNVNVFEGYCHQPIWTKHILFPSSGRCFSSYCHNLMIYWPFSKGLNIPNQHVNCFGWEILILSQSQALWTDVFFNVFFAVVFFWVVSRINKLLLRFHVLYFLERSCCSGIAHLPNAAKTGPGDSSRTWTCGTCRTRGRTSFFGAWGFFRRFGRNLKIDITCLKGLK